MSLDEALARAVAEVIDRRISELLDAPRLEMQPAFTIAEAAVALRCSESRVRKSIDEGRIPTIDVGGRGGLRVPGWFCHGLPAAATAALWVDPAEKLLRRAS